MIDLNQKVNEPVIEKMVQNRELVPVSGKELPKLDVGTKVLYEKNPDATKAKHPQWSKRTIKNRENPHKYHILADNNDRVVTRSRHHIKAYVTRSGRARKAPKHLIEHN